MLHLNPKDSEVVAPGSQLVFVAGAADAAVHMLETPYSVGWPADPTVCKMQRCLVMCVLACA